LSLVLVLLCTRSEILSTASEALPFGLVIDGRGAKIAAFLGTYRKHLTARHGMTWHGMAWHGMAWLLLHGDLMA